MADKSPQLILTALSQAVANAEGLPLFGNKASPGLFPTTAAGKQAAQRCLDEGYLRALPPTYTTDSSSESKERNRRANPECFTLTETGFTFLMGQVSPKQVLEDLVRVLEQRQSELIDLTRYARQMQQNLDALKHNTERILQTLQPSDDSAAGSLSVLFRNFRQEQVSPRCDAGECVVEQAIRTQLSRWQASSGAAEDCPLPELFRQLQSRSPGLTLGQFHDVLRRLRDNGTIYLHPWTGPLYDLPEPPKALLVGHEVAYYASLRTEAALAEAAVPTSYS